MDDLTRQSPLGVYIEHCRRGELAYQQCGDDGRAFFYPRVAAPGTGSTNLDWRVSAGLGTVYSTTVVHAGRDTLPYNVALVDLDEGFRVMSCVQEIDPMQVRIGMRVRVRIQAGSDEELPYPVFVPAEESA